MDQDASFLQQCFQIDKKKDQSKLGSSMLCPRLKKTRELYDALYESLELHTSAVQHLKIHSADVINSIRKYMRLRDANTVIH